uniref:Putative base excision DNA repair protein n=1 Tax=viral metagenome TaxID=1070528 RepID=A0A6M3JW05_9ZZZZ
MEREDDRRLIQEGLSGEWERLVFNILANRTNGLVAKGVVAELLSRWPTPESLAHAMVSEVSGVVRSCGLQNVKARRLVEMSATYLDGDWGMPEDLPGIGRYGGDSWRIFDGPVEGRSLVRPLDKALKRYMRRGYLGEG